ncbi:MAG: hypothetical protein L6R40_001408 [Gallowayella cf. fulva]|nr:MAG: hypothetical protein L6R40_001408 [Xanthomendoza cf. fulva]
MSPYKSSQCNLPIYTLRVLNSKIYVVTSPELISAVNRRSNALAFNPFVAQLGKRITGHDEPTSTIVQHNLNGETGPGYVVDLHDRTVTALSPGKHLEAMTTIFLEEAWSYLNPLGAGNVIDLFAWTKHMVTMCSTRAIYGPKNPFNSNPGFVHSFWDFDHDLNILIADVFPKFLAPSGYKARSNIAAAFAEYFGQYDAEKAQSSAMIEARFRTATQYGLTLSNQGCLEVGTLLGILANTIPSSFYMLVRLYTDQALLNDIREELEAVAVDVSPEGTRIINIMAVRESCHLLNATWQELLRVHALGVGSRYVREDVLLNDQYRLEKGRVVQMPMAVLHSDPNVWGPDAHEFRPRRFMKQSDTAPMPKVNLPGYRPFGGGASMCPGRHFVTLEVLALAACMVLRFDIVPVEGDWQIPVQKQESMATNVFPPKSDIKVKITRRQEDQEVNWKFKMR